MQQCKSCGTDISQLSDKKYRCKKCEREYHQEKSRLYNKLKPTVKGDVISKNSNLIEITNLASHYTKPNGLSMRYGELIQAVEQGKMQFLEEDIRKAVELGLLKKYYLLDHGV